MKKILVILLFSIGLYSCDDGDISVTNFDFEESNLEICEIGDKKILWVVNNSDVNESMSLELAESSLIDDLEEDLLTLNVEDTLEFTLAGNNRLVYRIYDGEINGNEYFCQGIPPGSPRVLEEYISQGGTVRIITNYNDLSFSADSDGDELENGEEGFDPEGGNHLDTDNDGIPDYLDIDDDNDNAPTERELTADPGEPTTEGGDLDTDQDGLPNYLDPDDDDDGVLTRYEVRQSDIEDGNLDPLLLTTSDDGTPNYLVEELENPSFIHELQIDHSIQRSYRSFIRIMDLDLAPDEGEIENIRFDFYDFGVFVSDQIIFIQLTDQQLENQEEEEEETTAP
ncbi:hypothetical protein DET49_12833 [Salegentibacter sp. 24]|uniref:hypothetical protein n=1 Tax=Salegentibacter sp. 24 TaxID=2183986 RepID=UPI001061C049|nr:hypothetical protein [Salegentibacter sp. 24]TDN81262.1 hypothetical protein DET49_12833 [Salegentibacter sp. 24]